MNWLKLATPSGNPLRLPALLMVAVLLQIPVSCAGQEPESTPEPPGSEGTSSPFSRSADPTGCVIEQITAAAHDEYQVQGVSGDGRLLSMAASPGGQAEDDSVYEVYELDLATGEKTDLSHILQNSGAFSPDGRFTVVAQATDNGKTDIFELQRATGALSPVAAHEEWDWLPSYSPDGRFILFNSYRVDGQSDIHLFERATGELRRLTEDPGYDAHAQFSPDGRRILFHRQRGEREGGGYIFDLMVRDIDAGVERRLTDGDFEESYPAWAPDGRHIVFSSDIDGEPEKHNLYLLGPDVETTARLTRGDWKDSYAFWTRDGNFIYFNSDRAGTSNIYRMPMKGIECVKEGA